METGRLKGWVVPGLDHPGLRILLLAKAMERLNARRIAKITKLTTSEWRVLSRLAPQKEGANSRNLPGRIGQRLVVQPQRSKKKDLSPEKPIHAMDVRQFYSARLRERKNTPE